jgi:undecaprenyl-diphosphatase
VVTASREKTDDAANAAHAANAENAENAKNAENTENTENAENADSGVPRRSAGRGVRPAPAVWVAAGSAVVFVLLVVMLLVGDGGPLPGDEVLHHWALHHRPAAARHAAGVLTGSGTGVWPFLLVAVVGYLTGQGQGQGGLGRGGRLRLAVAAVVALTVGEALRYALMEVVARPRPPRADWATHASSFSFPSGHATTSALAAALVCWAMARSARRVLGRCVQVLALVWAAAVGASRIYLGVHWPSDVLAGWLLATAYLAVLAALLARWRTAAGRP